MKKRGDNKQLLFYSPLPCLSIITEGKKNRVNNCIVVGGTHPHCCSAGSGFQLFHSVEADTGVFYLLDIVQLFRAKETAALVTTVHYIIIIEIPLFI